MSNRRHYRNGHGIGTFWQIVDPRELALLDELSVKLTGPLGQSISALTASLANLQSEVHVIAIDQRIVNKINLLARDCESLSFALLDMRAYVAEDRVLQLHEYVSDLRDAADYLDTFPDDMDLAETAMDNWLTAVIMMLLPTIKLHELFPELIDSVD